MLALRRTRMGAAPPFLRGGFRPFFFAGALWALLALGLWLAQLSGAAALPTAVDALAWHRHEMLFGFVGAVVAGFLLTAIPNWTGRLPIAGLPLASLAGLWLAGRVGLLFSGLIGLAAAAALDVAFFIVLGLIAGREVIAAKNRNLPVAGAALLLGLASGIDHAAIAGLIDDPMAGMRLGISIVTLLIAMIGGRIVPSFTRNWLMKRGMQQGLPTQPDGFDLLCMAVGAAALLAWTLIPTAEVSGLLLLGAAFLHLARLARWGGAHAASDPLVLMLHVAYLWLPVGLALLGSSIVLTAVPQTAAVHALTAGAMASMILAVMTRATLGHTGRALKSDLATNNIYMLITLAAVARVSAPFLGEGQLSLMRSGGTLWAAAFLLFLLRYGPMLFRPRLGESA